MTTAEKKEYLNEYIDLIKEREEIGPNNPRIKQIDEHIQNVLKSIEGVKYSRYRRLLHMSYLQGYTIERIAVNMDKSIRTINTWHINALDAVEI